MGEQRLLASWRWRRQNSRVKVPCVRAGSRGAVPAETRRREGGLPGAGRRISDRSARAGTPSYHEASMAFGLVNPGPRPIALGLLGW